MSTKKKKPTYKEGTVNGVKTGETRRLTRRERQEQEYKSLVKLLTSCICILIMVFVINWIVTSSFTFNGLNYEEPEEEEVIEIVSSSDEEEQTERVNLHLEGDLVVELEVGDEFVEPGYVATSELKGDISNKVIVSGNVDTSVVGTYKLTYTLSYRGIKPKLTRLVKVSEKKNNSNTNTNKPSGNNNSSSNNNNNNNNNTGTNPTTPSDVVTPSKPQGNITLKLNGESTVYITEGSSYNDAGATAIDTNGNNVSNKISVSGSVNPNVSGTYKITYSITNYNGEVLTVVRNVIVQAMGITLSLDNNKPTNKAVNIYVSTNVDNFDRLMLPNGTKVPNKTYTYKVTANGTYEFVVFNTAGLSRKATMIVSNIDKNKPKGKCVITHGEYESYITITASDESGIDKYMYAGDAYTGNVITIRRISTGVQINVGFYDKAGNYGVTNCLAP